MATMNETPEITAYPVAEYQLWLGEILIGNVRNFPSGWQFEPRCVGAIGIAYLANSLYVGCYQCINGVSHLVPVECRKQIRIWKMEDGERIEVGFFNPELYSDSHI